jgi:hypothetical protein
LEQQFFTPLSPQAYEEYLDLQEVIQQTRITTSGKDHWKYIWGMINIHRQNFTTFPIRMFSLLAHSFGFGTLATPTK